MVRRLGPGPPGPTAATTRERAPERDPRGGKGVKAVKVVKLRLGAANFESGQIAKSGQIIAGYEGGDLFFRGARRAPEEILVKKWSNSLSNSLGQKWSNFRLE